MAVIGKKSIIEMDKRELLKLASNAFTKESGVKLLTSEEILYILKTLGLSWQNYDNIVSILAGQIALRFWDQGEPNSPDLVANLPDVTNNLGKRVAECLGAKEQVLLKRESGSGVIVPASRIPSDKTLLLVGGSCISGANLVGAVYAILAAQPKVWVLPLYFPVISLRGLDEVPIEGLSVFKVVPLTTEG